MKLSVISKKRSRKGWIVIYVLVICSLVTITIMNTLGGLERRSVYIGNYMNNILKEDLKQKKKEYLMTEFNTYFEEHIDEIIEKGIEEYFKKADISKYLSSIERDGLKFKEGCNIEFDTGKNLFEVNVGTFIYRFYPIIDDSEVQYKFIVITDEEGI
ncbi:hypothetical protein [Clostridium culturomicium]|uniref:hypothetical protein n=1 Tax=Clostridium culturomicium TaxID=1499683 RepID=UPI00058FAF04|nr:hypothetical protein [Clostridium culturomicium]